MKPERKLWLDLKKNTPTICWNRIENLAVPGLPDLLGYNKHQHFFTVELKVTRGNKVRFSPHQIAFHVQHPKNTFILVKSLATRDWKLYEGKVIRELVACGLKPDNLEIRFSAAMVITSAPRTWTNTSTVVTKGSTCPAPRQGNECRDCRACWDPEVKNVAYGQH